MKVRLGARREWRLPNGGMMLVGRVPDPNYAAERLHVTLESFMDMDPEIYDFEMYDTDVPAAARALIEAYEWAMEGDYLNDEWDEYEDDEEVAST